MKRIALVLTAFITFAMINESQAQSTKVLIKTTLGDITIMLYDDTPIHRDNMLELIKKNVYDGTLFHRVIKGFMIQGGDPTSKDAKPGQMLGSGGPGYTIPAEFKPNHYHKKGALAAARQGDQVNPQKASSGSQFYIVQGNVMSVAQLTQMETQGYHAKFTEAEKKAYTSVGGTPHLDAQYTVFGEVTSGLDVVDKIAAVECSKPGDRPVKDVKIISATLIK